MPDYPSQVPTIAARLSCPRSGPLGTWTLTPPSVRRRSLRAPDFGRYPWAKQAYVGGDKGTPSTSLTKVLATPASSMSSHSHLAVWGPRRCLGRGGKHRWSPDDPPHQAGPCPCILQASPKPRHCPRLETWAWEPGGHRPCPQGGGENLGAMTNTVDSPPETAACAMGVLSVHVSSRTDAHTCKTHRANEGGRRVSQEST